MPKALVHLEGRTLLSYVLAAVGPSVDTIVLVVRPGTERAFEAEIRRTGWTGSVGITRQERPLGSADAVRIGIQDIEDDEACIVVWGDQVGISEDTVTRVSDALRQGVAGLILPLAEVASPYVWYCVRQSGVDVGRRRDGDVPPPKGKTDVGTFGFRPAHVRPYLESEEAGLPSGSRERDFVYVVPVVARRHGLHVVTVNDISETLAINDQNDLERAQLHFARTTR
jgi:NDP-sugar pyrophosphorylase family protein